MPQNYDSNLNSTILDATYKDESPLKTVEKIKKILSSYGIQTTENWGESGVEYCHSLRVNVVNTKLGVNGKGLTKEFALASAYGELMERMQLGLFSDSSVQKIGHYSEIVSQDEMIDTQELYGELPHWYEFLATKASQLDNETKSGKDIISTYANAEGKVAAVPFFNIATGKKVRIPRELRAVVCGSNGGAAGNTMEEAIVQAISEIFERNHQLRISKECISLPNIPDDVLKEFKIAYSIISNLRNKGFDIFIKDCSLGTRFPVVCVCAIDKKTGRYHTHFGAYPILEIAIERALTETFQGRNIEKFAKNEDFIYKASDVLSYRNAYMSLKIGSYIKTLDFFVGECKYPYNSNVGFSGKNNQELLSQILEYLASEGKEVLIYNSSCLGFPTYSVFIPKFSEVIFHSLSKKYNSFANAKSASQTLRNVKNAGFDDFLLSLLHISEMKKLSDIDSRLFSFATCANLPLSAEAPDRMLLSSSLAYIYYEMGNFNQALNHISGMLQLAQECDKEYLICIKRYLAMTLQGYNSEKTRELLELFHNKETVEKAYAYFDSGKNPFSDFVLSCDLHNCENCQLKSMCYYKYTMSLISIVREKSKELSFDELAQSLNKYFPKNN